MCARRRASNRSPCAPRQSGRRGPHSKNLNPVLRRPLGLRSICVYDRMPGRPGLTEKAADMALQSDRWRESRHEPGVGERQGRPRHRAPRRAGPHRPGEDHRARRLHRAAGHLWPQGREEAQQARGRPLRQGRRRRPAAASSSCASTRSTASRSVRRSRSTPLVEGQRGRRHRRQPWQGLRRRHEAPQLQGPGRQPR